MQESRERELERRRKELAARTPNPDAFEIEESEQIGNHMVLKVKYPNCRQCAYEGSKIMVFLDTSFRDVLRWRRIDPHFRAPTTTTRSEAPSPVARFPASAGGWADAIAYARSLL